MQSMVLPTELTRPERLLILCYFLKKQDRPRVPPVHRTMAEETLPPHRSPYLQCQVCAVCSGCPIFAAAFQRTLNTQLSPAASQALTEPSHHILHLRLHRSLWEINDIM